MENIIDILKKSELKLEEYKQIIDIAKEKIKAIKEKEREELYQKILDLYQEKNKLGKRIYSKKDIAKLTNTSTVTVNKALS
jgi:DNA-binding GntR family transcriptional regulator